jgi:mannose-6-phosphate isomerase-like protein (cupin superfamily)
MLGGQKRSVASTPVGNLAVSSVQKPHDRPQRPVAGLQGRARLKRTCCGRRTVSAGGLVGGRGAFALLLGRSGHTTSVYALAVTGHRTFPRGEFEFTPTRSGDRGVMRLSDALTEMRANVWRMPPGTKGVRHLEGVQEELFVVLEGTATLLLGDPPEPVELPQGSITAVEPRTPQQLINNHDQELVVLTVGAPPVEGEAEYLP